MDDKTEAKAGFIHADEFKSEEKPYCPYIKEDGDKIEIKKCDDMKNTKNHVLCQRIKQT